MILDEHSLCNIIMFTISINQISSKSFLKPMALVYNAHQNALLKPVRAIIKHVISYNNFAENPIMQWDFSQIWWI